MSEALPIYDDDEISLNDILCKLWRRRGLIVVLPVLAIILAIIVVALLMVKVPSNTQYYVELQGIEKSLYPNGVDFSPGDLLIPQVISRLAGRIGIKDSELLREGVSVNFATPKAQGIHKKYQQKLSARGLKATEIDTINRQFSAELERETLNKLLISVDTGHLNIDHSTGGRIAMLLPEIWSEVYTQEFRVLDDTMLQGGVLRGERTLRSTVEIFENQKELLSVEEGLEILGGDERLRALQSRDGTTPSDLLQQLTVFMDVYLSPIISSYLGTEDLMAKHYLRGLALKVEQINAQITNLNATISDINTLQSSRGGADGDPTLRGKVLQLTGNALEEVVNLASQATLSVYLTETFEKKHELVIKRSHLESERRMSEVNSSVEIPEPFYLSAERQLNSIIARYNELLTTAREINLNRTGLLYRGVGAPVAAGGGVPEKSLLYILLAALLGGFIAIVAALILPLNKDIEVTG